MNIGSQPVSTGQWFPTSREAPGTHRITASTFESAVARPNLFRTKVDGSLVITPLHFLAPFFGFCGSRKARVPVSAKRES